MTRCRTSPAMRLHKMPTATSSAARPDRERRGSVVLVGNRFTERSARALHQKGLDEHVDVAVENAVHVAHLLLRAVILDQLIGMQHVTANLAAERDLLLDAADLLELRLLLFGLQIVEPR